MIIKKVKKEYTEQVNTVTYMLLKRFDKRINPNKIKGYICETRRGKAFCEEKTFTIPLWAYLCGKDYFTYYVAHELSHIISRQRYRNGIHDKYFYKIFKKLCPEDLQLYELTYKRSASTKYGINGNIDIAMKKFNKKYKRVKKDYLTFF